MKYIGTYRDNQDIVTKEKIKNSVEYIIGAKPLPGGINYKIAYGGGKFVALNMSDDYASAAYSTDGINWEETTLPIDNIADGISNIAYGGGKFAVICRVTATVSYVVYSEDGITWSKSAMPEFRGRYSAIAYIDDRFVTIAGNTMSMYGVQVVTSSDLINWTTYTPSGLINNTDITCLVYGAGKLVAGYMGTNTGYCTPTDFATWSRIQNSAQLNLIAFGNNTFVGVNKQNGYVGMATSSFTSWNVNSAPYSFQFYDLVYGNGKFVALTSSTTNGILYSEDGTNWTEYASPRPKSGSSLRTIAYGDGKFVAIDNYGIVAISTDGKNWENHTTKWLQYPDGTDITEDVKNLMDVPTSYVSSVNGETGDVTIENAVSTTTDTDIVGLLKGKDGKVAAAEAGTDYAENFIVNISSGDIGLSAVTSQTATMDHTTDEIRAAVTAGNNVILRVPLFQGIVGIARPVSFAGTYLTAFRGRFAHPGYVGAKAPVWADFIGMIPNQAGSNTITYSLYPIQSPAIPIPTESDNGKILQVVDGVWAAASLPTYDGGVS